MGLEDLIVQAANHRRVNNLEVPKDFAEQVEAFIAYRIPPELAVGFPSDREVSSRMWNQMTVNNNTQQMLMAPREYIPQKTAETRATICANCPANIRICASCNGLDLWVRGFTENRKTMLDKHMGVCQNDGVLILADLHLKRKYGTGYVDYCWKKNG